MDDACQLPVGFSLERFADFDAGRVTIEPVEPVDSLYGRFGGRCVVLRNILTPEECTHIIQELSVDMQQVRYREDYRQNDRSVFSSAALADILWSRVQPFMQNVSLQVDAEDPAKQRLLDAARPASEARQDADACPDELRVGYGSEGVWQPIGLNECLRFCRYNAGGFFRPHCDAQFKRSEDEQSFFTCMFYLDGGFEGGSTRFMKLDSVLSQDTYLKVARDEQVLATVDPEPGICILFFQPGLLHEGTDLAAGSKHILRTDVLFRRDPSTKAQRTPAQVEALALVKKAQELEANNECDAAWPLYRRAFKLDPKLERMF
eukprot:TRINITY_DN14718_c0_g1_i2.p1 TRINITY_DN14718_c0_g1~~TRINITY_DN14718_c0_g1_i2.p1  ORF type:complete len:348 (-),score=69.55 TRINITY_DN14718_c0_g1_i2:138-1094(-)